MRYLILGFLLLTGCSQSSDDTKPHNFGFVACKDFGDGDITCGTEQNGKIYQWQATTPDRVRKQNQ